jgi:TrmH family RNA methyltransferase
MLVEGPQAVSEAAKAGLVADLFITDDVAARRPEIAARTLENGGYVHAASAPYLRAISPDNQGVAAVANDPWRRAPGQEGLPLGLWGLHRLRLVAVFEQIRDPGNAGTAIRAADAAGADLVLFADRSVDPGAPKVVRSSAGSYFHIPVVSTGPVAELAPELQAAGLRILAADATGAGTLYQANLSGPTAWLFGNEARGLSPAARAVAERSVAIPIYGQAESLNLAMAATLCLYASAAALNR